MIIFWISRIDHDDGKVSCVQFDLIMGQSKQNLMRKLANSILEVTVFRTLTKMKDIYRQEIDRIWFMLLAGLIVD